MSASVSSTERHVDEAGRIFEGQLYKFTNVVKGWQYRWFVLDSEAGLLEYFLLEECGLGRPLVGKNRGAQKLCGCLVVPSDEDSQTFTVNFASGESYKLRAENAKERQVWVDRIRRVALMFDRAVTQNQSSHVFLRESHKPATPPPGAKSQLTLTGEPTDALQHLSLSVLDAFGSAYDMLQQSDAKHQVLARTIESLPVMSSGGNELDSPTCHDQDLLILKATSQASLICLENALAVLQDLQDQQHPRQAGEPMRKNSVNIFNTPRPPRPSRKMSSTSDAFTPGSSVFASPSSTLEELHHDHFSQAGGSGM